MAVTKIMYLFWVLFIEFSYLSETFESMETKRPYIKITGVSRKLKTEVENVANYSGNTLSGFIKLHLSNIVKAYSPEVREGKYRD